MQNASHEKKGAEKSLLHRYRLSTDERCWFQTLLEPFAEKNVQCKGSADPIINSIANQYARQGKRVAVISVDSDLHSTALRNVNTFIWLPKSLFAKSFVFIQQPQLLLHYRHVFCIKQTVTDDRLIDMLQDSRLLAGTKNKRQINISNNNNKYKRFRRDDKNSGRTPSNARVAESEATRDHSP